MKEVKIESLKNLKKVVDDLNATKVYEFEEGEPEEFESPFHFVIKKRDDLYKGAIAIYDENEEYDINYSENMSYLTGHSYTDTIKEKLENAIQKDLKSKDAYLEHYDSVIMVIAL